MSLSAFDSRTRDVFLDSPEDPEMNPEEELLVAYLDGEVEPEERRELEDRLAGEPQLRQKLVELDSSWRALNYLEPDRTDRDLVRSTMELICVNAETEVQRLTEKKARSFTKRPLGFVAELILCVFFGYVCINMFFGGDEERLYEDLMIIERLDQYQLLDERKQPGIDEIEFLRELYKSNILD